jgi:hypothetical protein
MQIDYVTDAVIETSCIVPTVKLFDDPDVVAVLPTNLIITCSVGVYELAPVLGLEDNNLVTVSLYQYVASQTVDISGESIDIPESIAFKYSLISFQELHEDVAKGNEAIEIDYGDLFLLPQVGYLSPSTRQFLGRLEPDGNVIRVFDAVDSLPYQDSLTGLGHNQVVATWALEQEGRALRLNYLDGGQQALIQKLSLDDHDWQYLVTFSDQNGQFMYRIILSLGVVSWQNSADLLVSYSDGENYLKQKTSASSASPADNWFAYKFSEEGPGTYVPHFDGTPF